MGKKSAILTGLLAAALAGYIVYDKVISPVLYKNNSEQEIEEESEGFESQGKSESLETKVNEPVVVNNEVNVNVNVGRDSEFKEHGKFRLGKARYFNFAKDHFPGGKIELKFDLDSAAANPGYGEDLDLSRIITKTVVMNRTYFKLDPVSLAAGKGALIYNPGKNIFEIPKDAEWQEQGNFKLENLCDSVYVRSTEGKIFKLTLHKKQDNNMSDYGPGLDWTFKIEQLFSGNEKPDENQDDGPKDRGRFNLGQAHKIRLSTSPRGQWQILEQIGYDLDSHTQNPRYGQDVGIFVHFEDTPFNKKTGYSPMTFVVPPGASFYQGGNGFEIPKDAKCSDGMFYFHRIGESAFVKSDHGKFFKIPLYNKERQVSVIHYTLKFEMV